MDKLNKLSINYQVVLTKVDKTNRDHIEKIVASSKEIIPHHRIVTTSSKEGYGVAELRINILNILGLL